MPALSTGTYGKGSPVTTTTTTSDFADRLTAVLDAAVAAIEGLDRGTATGAPVDQASVNTLRKVVQDLGALATDVRNEVSDAAAKEAAAKTAASSTTAGTSSVTGSGTTKS